MYAWLCVHVCGCTCLCVCAHMRTRMCVCIATRDCSIALYPVYWRRGSRWTWSYFISLISQFAPGSLLSISCSQASRPVHLAFHRLWGSELWCDKPFIWWVIAPSLFSWFEWPMETCLPHVSLWRDANLHEVLPQGQLALQVRAACSSSLLCLT